MRLQFFHSLTLLSFWILNLLFLTFWLGLKYVTNIFLFQQKCQGNFKAVNLFFLSLFLINLTTFTLYYWCLFIDDIKNHAKEFFKLFYRFPLFFVRNFNFDDLTNWNLRIIKNKSHDFIFAFLIHVVCAIRVFHEHKLLSNRKTFALFLILVFIVVIICNFNHWYVHLLWLANIDKLWFKT
jgi:hypothetical protein